MNNSVVDSIGLMTLLWFVVLWAFGRSLLRLFALLWQDAHFRRLLGVVTLMLIAGAHIYHRLEGWSYLNALYFTVITLTTIGYGDFSPQTNLGKIFSMLYILLGLGVLGALIGLISSKSEAWADALRPKPASSIAKGKRRQG